MCRNNLIYIDQHEIWSNKPFPRLTARTSIGIRDKSFEDVSFDRVAPQIIELINVEMICCGIETRAGVVRKWLLSLKPPHQ